MTQVEIRTALTAGEDMEELSIWARSFVSESAASLFTALSGLFWPLVFFAGLALLLRRGKVVDDVRRVLPETTINFGFDVALSLDFAKLANPVDGESRADVLGLVINDLETWDANFELCADMSSRSTMSGQRS